MMWTKIKSRIVNDDGGGGGYTELSEWLLLTNVAWMVEDGVTVH